MTGISAVELSINTSNFDGSIDQSIRLLTAMGAELQAVQALGTNYENSIEGLSKKQEILTRSVEASNLTLTEQRKKYDELIASGSANTEEIEKQATAVNEALVEYNRLNTQLKDVDTQLSEQSSKWNKFQEFGGKVKSVGDTISTLTAPIKDFGVFAFNAAVDFESAFAGVRQTVNTSEENFKKLEDGIRSMAKELPVSATEIAGVVESAGQLGIAEEHLLSFSRTVIDMGNSTNMTREQAAKDFADFANIVGMGQGDFDRLGSSIVELSSKMGVAASDIMTMGMGFAEQASKIGLTESQIMGLAATMSSLGINAETGGAAMTSVLQKIQKAVGDGGESLSGFAKAANMSSADFKKAFETDAASALDALVKGLAESSEGGANLKSVLADLGVNGDETDVLLKMADASDVLTSAVNSSTDAWNQNTALSDKAAERYKTTEAQMAMMKNELVDIGISIGNILIPIVKSFLEKLQPWIEKFSNLSEGTKKFITIIGGIVAVIGPILGAIGTFITTIGTIIEVVGGLGSVIAALSGPIGWAVAAIAGLIGVGVLLYKNWEGIATFFSELWTSITEAASNAWEGFTQFLSDSWQSVVEGAEAIWTGLVNMLTGIWTSITEAASNVWEGFTQFLSNLWESIVVGAEAIWTGLVDMLTGIWTNITEAASNVWEGFTQFLTDLWQSVVEGAEAIWTSLVDMLTGIWTSITEMASDAWIAFVELLTGIWTSLVEIATTTWDTIVSTITDIVTTFIEQVIDVFSTMGEGITEIFEGISNFFSTAWESIKQIFADALDTIYSAVEAGWNELKGVTEIVFNAVMSFLSEVWANVKNAIVGTVESIIDLVVSGWTKFSQMTTNTFNSIKDFLSNVWESIKTAVVNIASQLVTSISQKFLDIKSAIETKMNEVKKVITDIWDKVVSFFSAVDLRTIGKDIIQGLINGIGDMAELVWEKAKSIATSIGDAIKGTLKINSPSRVMIAIGKGVGEGLAKGIEHGSEGVNRAADKLAEAAIPNFSQHLAVSKEVIEKAQQIISNATKANAAEMEALQKEAENKRIEISQKATEKITAIKADAAKQQIALTDDQVAQIKKIEEQALKDREAITKQYADKMDNSESSSGMMGMQSSLQESANNLVRNVSGTLKKALNLNPTSSILQEIGDSLANGFETVMNKATNVSKQLANSVVQETESLLPLQKSKNNAAPQNSGPSTIVVQSILDGQIVGESVVDVVSGKQYSNASIHALTRGVSGI